MSVFSKPAIHENFFCPHCHRLLAYGTQRCKYCHEEIDEEYARVNAYIHFQLTQASSQANTIGTLDPAVIFFAIASLCMRWLKLEFYGEIPRLWTVFEIIFSLFWLLPLVAIIVWFYRYRRWRIIDEDEYQSKRKSMRLSFRMWLAAYVFQVVLLVAFSGAK
jgi:RNA polymerase subunit RPABC4/transcription elongation factor Spt4